ncbi:CRS2-associated factor 2 [Asimina triloba]
MPILATISQNPNLFNPFPSNPPRIPNDKTQKNPPPPIPIPKYPPKKSPQKLANKPTLPPNPAFKTVHRGSKYYKPIPADGIIAKDDSDRTVVLGESGVSYRLPGAPIDFQFSYSETPRAKPLAIREPAFLPFAPPTMPRPWTGKAPLKKKKKNVPLLEPFNPATPSEEGQKRLEMPRALNLGRYPKSPKTREQILGKPLTRAEARQLVEQLVSCNRQERSGGKIIHRVGGVVYLFRGRNYDHRTRPVFPTMLWKPAAPVYPKLIQDAPEGLTKLEADDLRRKGQDLLPICKLAKNGIYMNLVKDVRYAFDGSPLVKVDCKGLEPSDYKKIGAKLMELVPCVLLSFEEEQILMWRGKDWKSIYQGDLSPASDVCLPSSSISSSSVASDTQKDHEVQLTFLEERVWMILENWPRPVVIWSSQYFLSSVAPCLHEFVDHDADARTAPKTAISSPRMMSLWKRAIDANKALFLDNINLAPDALLKKVEEFEGISQATVHSYPALILPSGDVMRNPPSNYIGERPEFSADVDNGEEDNDDDITATESFEEFDSSIPIGSLPVDLLAKRPMLE